MSQALLNLNVAIKLSIRFSALKLSLLVLGLYQQSLSNSLNLSKEAIY